MDAPTKDSLQRDDGKAQPAPVKVLILDRDNAFAESALLMLCLEPGTTAIGWARNVADACERHAHTSPDVVLADWASGVREFVAGTAGLLPRPRMVVVADEASMSEARACLREGEDVLLSLRDIPHRIPDAVRGRR